MDQNKLDNARREILGKKYTVLNRKGRLFQEMIREGWNLKLLDRNLCVMTRVHGGFHYTRTIVGSSMFPKVDSKYKKVEK